MLVQGVIFSNVDAKGGFPNGQIFLMNPKVKDRSSNVV